jgi:hypothetical protein
MKFLLILGMVLPSLGWPPSGPGVLVIHDKMERLAARQVCEQKLLESNKQTN